MRRARTVLAATVLGVCALAATGCTAGPPTAAAHSPSAHPSPHGAPHAAADATSSYAEPAASKGDLLRVVMGGGVQEVSGSAETSGDVGDTSVLFSCTGQSGPMGYSLYVDGSFEESFAGATCNGQSYRNTGVLGLRGAHRVAITITGGVGETTEAYAVLVRGN